MSVLSDRWIKKMALEKEMIKPFVIEQKSDKISYSVRLFNENNERILDCFITKMYDMNKNLISSRKKLYDNLFEKYGSRKILNFKNNEY